MKKSLRMRLGTFKISSLLLGMCALSLPGTVFAVTKTASGSGSWNSSGIWTPSGVPAAGDDVVIPNTFTVTTGSTTQSCASLDIQSGGILTFSGGSGRNIVSTGNVTVAGTINMTGSNAYWLSFGGNLTIASTATLAMTSSNAEAGFRYIGTGTQSITNNSSQTIGSLNLTGSGTLNTGSNMTFSKAITVGTATTTFNIASGHTVTVTGGATTVSASGGKISVSGTLVNQSATAMSLTGTGAVTLASGGTFVHQNAAGISTPLGLFTMNSASNFIYRATAGTAPSMSLSGRTFGNLRFDNTSGTWSSFGGATGSGIITCTSLTIGNTATGATGTVQANFTGITGTFAVGTGGLSILSGHTLSLATGNAAITLTGDWTNSGTFTSGTGTVTLNAATADQTVTGATTFNNLTVDKATSGKAILASATTVSAALTLSNNASLEVSAGVRLTLNGSANLGGRPVTLKSTSSADATIGYGTTSITNATAVTFERYLGARRSYRYLTTPVTTSGTFYANWMEGGSSAAGFGTKVTGNTTNASGFDATSFNNNPSAYTWDGSLGWKYLTSTGSTIAAGEPYRLFVRGDRTINVNDPNATATATVLRSTGTLFTAASKVVTLESGASYYSFVGNPYASVLDFGFAGITKTNLTGFIYVWDAGIGGANGRGAYVTVNVAANTNNISGSGGSKYIQPGQAFFVRSSAASPALTIPTTALVTGNHVSIMDAQTPNLLRASLFAADELNSGIARDGFVLLFDAGFTKEASIVEDAEKMTNPDENLGILRGDKRFAIELLPEPTTGDEVPVFSSQYRGKAYSFVVDGSQWQTGSNLVAYLVDKFTGTETAVNAGEKQQYDFSVDAGVAASVASDRFVIRFAAGSTLPVQFTNLQAIPRNGSVSLVWSVASEQNRLKYEVERSADGRSFSNLKSVSARGTGSIAASYDLVDAQPVNGVNYYRVKAIDVNGNSSYSNVVKANLGKISKGIELYPNPVSGRQFQLGLNDMPAGKYSISLYSSNGQLIEVQSLQHNGGSVNQQVTLSKTLSTGYYQLRVQGNNGEQQVLQLIAK